MYPPQKSFFATVSQWLLWLILLLAFLPHNAERSFIVKYFPQLVFGFLSIMMIIRIGKLPSYIVSFWTFSSIMFIFGIVAFNGSLSNGITSGMRLFYPCVFLTIGYVLQDRINEKKLTLSMFLLLTVELVFSILQTSSLEFREFMTSIYTDDSEAYLEIFRYTRFRAIGTIGNPNLLSLYSIVLMTNIIFRLNTFEKRNGNVLRVLSIVFSTLICIEAQSREGIIVFLLVVFLYMIFTKKRRKSFMIVVPIALTFAYFLYVVLSVQIYREINLEGLLPRISVWSKRIQSAISESDINILFGIGYQNSRQLGFFDNIYLKYFLAGGIVGIIPFIITIYLTIKKCLVQKSYLSFTIVAIWLVSCLVADIQESLKIASIAFFTISYNMDYSFEEKWKQPQISSDELSDI